MHAVSADQRIAGDAFAVRKMQRHAASVVVEADAARIEPDRIGLERAHRIDQHLMQVGAMDHEIGRAVARDRLGAEIEQLPGLARIPEPDFLACRLAPDLAQRLFEPEREQHARAVRRNLHARAELGELRRLLIDLDFMAVAQQRERGREPADARADDQDAHSLSRHRHPRGRPKAGSPESITTEFAMWHGLSDFGSCRGYGFRAPAFAASRNDRRERRCPTHTPPRARRLFRDRRPAAAEAAGRRAARVLDHREPGSVGHRQADGAAGTARADGAADAARRAELELARIRHARRRVAFLRSVPAARNQTDALDQRARLRGLRAGRAAGQGRRLGVHGPFVRTRPDPQGAGPGRDDRALDGHPGEVHRQAAGRLARARPDADLRDAGAARGSRREIHRRLGLRRRADRDPHRQRSAGHAALFGGAERHPDDDRAASRERLSA